MVKRTPEGNQGSVSDTRGPTHLLRIDLGWCARNVPTCLCPSCGNFIISSWNTCLRLTPSPTFLLFDSTNMFSRSRYTPAFLSVLSCQTSLSASVLFLLLPPFLGFFFQRRCAVSRSVPLSRLCIHILTDILAFSHERTHFSPSLSGCCHFPFLSAQ